MEIPAGAKAVAKKVGGYTALFAVFGVVGSLWINTEVERRMKELAKDPSTHPAIVEMRTTQINLREGQARIEGKVDTFSAEFLRYLERQSQ